MTETKPDLLPLQICIDRGRDSGDETAIALRIGDMVHVINDPFAAELAKLLDRPTPSPDQVPGEVLEQSLEALKMYRLFLDVDFADLSEARERTDKAITALEQHLKGGG